MVGSCSLRPEFSAWEADLGQPGADRRLPCDEGRASCRATLLPVPVGEHHALLRNAIDVGRLVAHHAQVIGADVVPADVITPDHEDVGLLA